MQFDGLLQLSAIQYQQPECKSPDFIQKIDSQHNVTHTFPDHLPITLASYKPIRAEENFRQELSMDIFEQSHRKQSELPLFYKLSQDFMKEEDEGGCRQKDEEIRQMRSKNDTKNIPKNFGKGIINFIEKHQKKVKQLLLLHALSHQQFFKILRHEKRTINTIADLRKLWTNPKFGRVMRMVSNLFLREYALEYIFNSRISSYSTHIKYRYILCEALKDPSNFNHIKQY